ncbi:hypothetical protein ACFWGP_05625 [Agromyces sp. NPDC127015]|uniref:hypothetical protein n=1 Tax=Agromyces sp. NPDC127015 TaxID=3347108 RepID=UPI00365B9AFA
MSDVMTLPARSRSTDPETSVAAEPDAAVSSLLHYAVLELFAEHGPMTDHELNQLYVVRQGVEPWLPRVRFDTPRKRRSELTARRMLVDSGETRKNPWGKREVVWRLPEKEEK